MILDATLPAKSAVKPDKAAPPREPDATLACIRLGGNIFPVVIRKCQLIP